MTINDMINDTLSNDTNILNTGSTPLPIRVVSPTPCDLSHDPVMKTQMLLVNTQSIGCACECIDAMYPSMSQQ